MLYARLYRKVLQNVCSHHQSGFQTVKPGFTNYQPHPSSLGQETKLKGRGTKVDESKHT